MKFMVLIVDDMAIIRQPMALSLKKSGYEVSEASSGVEALKILGQQKVDLLLLDVSMPEMDGLTVLRHLREMKNCKDVQVILLTGMGDRETVLKAASLGVRDYMLKSTFSLKELLARVQRLLSPIASNPVPQSAAAPASPAAPTATSSAAPNTVNSLTREQTHARLEKITGTRTCAGVVAQVMALVNSPRSEIGDLVRVIETDPILASRVLQLANSPAFRQRSGRLANIEDAVRNVGMRSIQSMVVSIGIFEAFPPNQADGFNTLRCWQHCFAVAAILRVLLAHCNEEEREHMALVGLCHDLGEIVLRQHFATEFETILRHAEATGQSPAAVETLALSMRHGELVREVLTRIGLPASIALPIMRFHDGDADPPAEHLQAVRLLQIANGLAHGIMLAPSSEALLMPFSRAEVRRACGSDQVSIDLPQLRNDVLTSTNILARLPMEDESQFVRPLIERRPNAIWYARHAGYSDLDPVATALDMLGHVRVEGRLPQGRGELECADVIIAASPFVDSSPVILNELRVMRESDGYHGQPVIILPGNAGNEVPPDVTVVPLPVSLKMLAAHVTRSSACSSGVS